MQSIIFKYGSEWAPDSRYGIDILELGADGRFHYENRTRGEVKTISGRLDPGVLGEAFQDLREAGFPVVPTHAIPPGSSIVELAVPGEHGNQTALMDYFTALKLPGYGTLIKRFSAWTSWLRGDAETAPPGIVRE